MVFKGTRFIYENSFGDQIIFDSESSPFKLYIDGIDSLSSNTIELGENTVSGRVGSKTTSKRITSKIVTLNGDITEDIKNNRKLMISTIYPLDEGKLIFEDGDDRYYLDVTPKMTPDISTHEDIERFQIVLLAAYPFWKNGDGYSSVTFGEIISHYKYPQSFSSTIPFKISSREDSSVLNIYSKPKFDVGFKMRVKILSNTFSFTITNTLTQEHMTIERPGYLSDNTGYIYDVSTIQNEKYVRLIDPSGEIDTGLINKFYGTLFSLHHGDNPLSLGEGSHANVLVTIFWEDVLEGI